MARRLEAILLRHDGVAFRRSLEVDGPYAVDRRLKQLFFIDPDRVADWERPFQASRFAGIVGAFLAIPVMLALMVIYMPGVSLYRSLLILSIFLTPFVVGGAWLRTRPRLVRVVFLRWGDALPLPLSPPDEDTWDDDKLKENATLLYERAKASAFFRAMDEGMRAVWANRLTWLVLLLAIVVALIVLAGLVRSTVGR